ncbi:TetR/AcrR family transcriptional regulator [Allosalinactinospora lopnorensis]|uniref:TetR/AcrR family transcriptional regulator n=1 Tax=Allosalinactinospora lopnorensis TaxID=1352348 RepID=UPI000623D3EE|nr:TetR family transcriptional regulator [Allosalinactinospora lopnorensis]
MARNPERRTALLEAAIGALAEEGARGLTFRVVDVRAGVPVGTASNYFSSRDDLLTRVGGHLYVRFAPESAEVAEAVEGERSRERVAELMRWMVRRLSERRNVYLALMELRLEATRRPALQETLTRRVRADLEANMRFHEDTGMPGGRSAVLMLYLALTGLLVEHLTLPGVLEEEGPLESLIDTVVERIVPER